MNKCSKCGAEFEGNFCPECGTPSLSPKVCPKCGAQLKENVKFCNNCGYAFLPTHSDETQTASSAPSAKAHAPVDWRNNKTLRKILLFAPLVIFALWSVLMFAFMAAPVLDGGGLIDNVTVYGFFNAETVEGDPDLAAITPSAATLLAVSLLSVLYAGWLAYAQFKGDKMTRWLSHYASALLYILVLVCTSVIAVKFNAYAEGMDDMKGSFVGVTVALTVVFLLLHAASLVLCKLLSIESITREEREQAKQRFAEWRAYRKQRRPVVAQRLKKEPFIRGRSCGAMCILAIIFLVVGCFLLRCLTQSLRDDIFRDFMDDEDVAFVIILQFLIPTIISIVLGIVACVLSFLRKWRVSAVLGWVFFIVSCIAFVCINLPIGKNYYKDTEDFLRVNRIIRNLEIEFQMPFFALLAGILFSLVNVLIQAYDECKARKRYNREYDEQMAAQGDKTALRMLNNQ